MNWGEIGAIAAIASVVVAIIAIVVMGMAGEGQVAFGRTDARASNAAIAG